VPHLNLENLIGWYNNSRNHFLCDKCAPDNPNELEGYEPVMEDDLEDNEDLYTCDECGERFR